MPKFVIDTTEHVYRRYIVEAENEVEAWDIFYDNTIEPISIDAQGEDDYEMTPAELYGDLYK
ncbi:MAG: hypothetical protein WC476_01320 [Phycisphaerae bacterium]|jgi:hypothetical protein